MFFKSLLCTAALVFSGMTAAQNAPIYIGLDADLSSGAVEGGLAIQRGAVIAIEELNKKGGILGRPIELVSLDHRGNPARGIRNIKTLAKQENLIAVLGGVHTPVALEELATIHENKLIYLNPWAAGTAIVDNNYQPNYVFRVSVRDAEAAKVMMKHAKDKGLNKVALVLERTGWGRSNQTSLSQAAQDNGIEITLTTWINWRQKDFSDSLANIVASQPDAIMLVANAPEGSLVARQMSEQNIALPIVSHWGISGGSFVSSLGLSHLRKLDISVLQTFSFVNNMDDGKKAYLLHDYRQRYDHLATESSIKGVVGLAHAYDLVHLVAIATEQAGSLNREDIRSQLEAIESYHGVVKHYSPPFTPDQHDALLSDDYFMTRYNDNGELVPVNLDE